jgi:uncharacterized tellurite resistance protein B-like protein
MKSRRPFFVSRRVFCLVNPPREEPMKNQKISSKHNAIKHGVFADILISGRAFGEEATDYQRFVSMLRESLRPTSGLGETLVEKLAALLLRLSRVYKADAEMAPKMFARVIETLSTKHSVANPVWVSPEDQVMVVRKEPTPDLILRYEANLERQIARTLDQIAGLGEMGGDVVKLVQTPPELKAALDGN